MISLRLTFMLGLLMAIFLGVGFYFAGIVGMTTGFMIALIINFFSYWYSDKIVLSIYKAERMREKDYPDIYDSVKKLTEKAQLPMPKLYIIKTDVPNAFATGRSPKNSAIAITKGLLSKLSVEEIEGVIAHELSHIKHRDTLISTMVAAIAGAISWLAYLFYFGSNDNRNAFSFLLMFILAPVAASLIRMAISRGREYYADEEGAHMSQPLYLANALEKIDHFAKNVRIRGNPSTAHMFIINPFRGDVLLSLFSTHPPTEQRIARLRRMAA